MQQINDSFIFDAADLTKSVKIDGEGLLNSLILVNPAFTEIITSHVSILDNEANEIYASAEKAKGATHLITGLAVPIGERFSVKITLSGVAGGTGGTVKTKLFIENR